jgi:hypothetical protein
MDTLYGFSFEGENVDGDLINSYIEFKNCEDATDALKLAEKEAETILKDENGGHIDIFNEDGGFMTDVEI